MLSDGQIRHEALECRGAEESTRLRDRNCAKGGRRICENQHGVRMRSYAFCAKRIEDAYVYYSVVRKKEVV